VRYPTDEIEQFYASWPPRVSRGRGGGGGGAGGPSQNELALTELLEKTGPAIVFLHSFAGGTGFDVARDNPGLVLGIVALEPTGCPDEEQEVPWDFAQIPFLAVYGDFIDQRNQGGRLANCQKTAELVNAKGGTGEVIQLTERGIFGNTHLYPQDNNNQEIARIIIKWLRRNVTRKDD
jgi:pimeloyl-ACP methyl ester carboxylesterase